MPEDINYVIGDARYAKGQKAVHVAPNGLGLKTRADCLLGALNARYSHREHAYIISPRRAEKFETLFAEGWDATIFGELVRPREPVGA